MSFSLTAQAPQSNNSFIDHIQCGSDKLREQGLESLGLHQKLEAPPPNLHNSTEPLPDNIQDIVSHVASDPVLKGNAEYGADLARSLNGSEISVEDRASTQEAERGERWYNPAFRVSYFADAEGERVDPGAFSDFEGEAGQDPEFDARVNEICRQMTQGSPINAETCSAALYARFRDIANVVNQNQDLVDQWSKVEFEDWKTWNNLASRENGFNELCRTGRDSNDKVTMTQEEWTTLCFGMSAIIGAEDLEWHKKRGRVDYSSGSSEYRIKIGLAGTNEKFSYRGYRINSNRPDQFINALWYAAGTDEEGWAAQVGE